MGGCRYKKRIILFSFLLFSSVLFSALAEAILPLPYNFDPKTPLDKKFDAQGAFNIDLHSGAAIYTYEMRVPPGTNDLEPEMILHYNSHGALTTPGLVGDGWQLSESYIQRDINGSATNTSDDIFTLFLNGVSYRLVYGPENNRYHTQVETFLHIQNLSTTNNEKGVFWFVRTKEGTSYRFGWNKDAELVGTEHTQVVRWYLDMVQDTHNNTLFYSYSENPFTNDKGATYPSNITYNN